MAKQNVVHGKVQDQGNGKFKIEKGNQPNEVDTEIDMRGAGSYEVEKLEVNGLPNQIDGTKIRWLTNFSIRHKGGGYVKQTYRVTIPGLSQRGTSRLVIYSDTHDPKLYYYEGTIDGDTFELSDGDPAGGAAP